MAVCTTPARKSCTSPDVFIHGLPANITTLDLYAFIDKFCIVDLHARFPDTYFLRQNARNKMDNVKSATVWFTNEEDAERFCLFPHHNPFPGHTLAIIRKEKNTGRIVAKVNIDPPEINQNPMIASSIVFFEMLPRDVTASHLIELIGCQFIQTDENGDFCLKIFYGRATVSAKVMLRSSDDAESLVEACNGLNFYPFDVLIQVSIN